MNVLEVIVIALVIVIAMLDVALIVIVLEDIKTYKMVMRKVYGSKVRTNREKVER